MKRFFAENWLWIALPFAAIVIGIVILLVLSGGDSSHGEFVYPTF